MQMPGNIEIRVSQVYIHEWLNDYSRFADIKHGLKTHPAYFDFQRIIRSEEVYLINLFGKEENQIIHAVFFTDLDVVTDVTAVELHTSFYKCAYERIDQYCNRMSRIIADYVYGDKLNYLHQIHDFDRFNLIKGEVKSEL